MEEEGREKEGAIETGTDTSFDLEYHFYWPSGAKLIRAGCGPNKMFIFAADSKHERPRCIFTGIDTSRVLERIYSCWIPLKARH